MTTKYNDMIKMISTAPESQLDKNIADRLNKMSFCKCVKSDEILTIIDECVHASLASDFVIGVLDCIWRGILTEENKTVEEANEAAAERRAKMMA